MPAWQLVWAVLQLVMVSVADKAVQLCIQLAAGTYLMLHASQHDYS
jgi:hypothetical protein